MQWMCRQCPCLDVQAVPTRSPREWPVDLEGRAQGVLYIAGEVICDSVLCVGAALTPGLAL